jgi:hypothetical protein
MNRHEFLRADLAELRRTQAAWIEARKTTPPTVILTGLERALNSREWAKRRDRGEIIPSPSVWLAQRGWELAYTPMGISEEGDEGSR